MSDDRYPNRRGWFQLEPDGTFDWDCPQYGEPEPGTWIMRGRDDGAMGTLVGIPPLEPPAGSKHGDRYPRGVLTQGRHSSQGRDARASASGRWS